MLSELFERLPEVGDPEKPKMVFFFDEAHLLFDDAPDALVEKIEQVVRLIRSKGVGVLLRDAEPARHSGHGARPARQPRAARAARVHAARSEGRADGRRDAARQSGVRHRERRSPSWPSAKRSSRASTRRARPTIVERAWILPPASRIGPITAAGARGGHDGVARCRATTSRRSTASRPTRS